MKAYRIIRFIWLHFLMVSFISASCFNCYADNPNVYPNGGIIPDSAAVGNNVGIDKAANGVPVVNINDPNSAGVSHNKFIDFNVEERGVILNNSQVDINSERGGIVHPNPNLHNHASTIINEVTSTKSSHINGPTEIVGPRADYILANPNGISVNGLEFINVHKATLTTGTVHLDSRGSVEKLLVEKGNIEFKGKSLNLKNLDYFDIISLTTKLNAEIHAGPEIKIVTGKNSYDTKNRIATPTAHQRGSSSELAIDSSMLGGIYAGKITIVSNKKGVGVNLPNIESKNDNVEITADGKVVHRNIKSANNLDIHSASGEVRAEAKSSTLAKGQLKIIANKAIKLGAESTTKSEKNIKLECPLGDIENEGLISAESELGIDIVSNKLVNNGDINTEQGDLRISSKQVDNKGTISSGKSLPVNDGISFDNFGKIQAKKALSFSMTEQFTNHSNARIATQNSLSISAGDFINKQAARVEAELAISFSLRNQLVNQGLIKANLVNVNSIRGGLNNTGNLLSLGGVMEVRMPEGILENRGNIYSKLDFNGREIQNLYNHGKITTHQNFLAKVSSDIHNKGNIAAVGRLEVSAGNNFKNENDINSDKSIKITVDQDVTNSGSIKGTDINITSKNNSFNNLDAGYVGASSSLNILSSGVLSNLGFIVSTGPIDLDSQNSSIDNNGYIHSTAENVKLTADQNITNIGNIVGLNVDITSKNNSFNNLENGRIGANSSLNILSSDILSNAGFIAATGPINLDSQNSSLDNKGDIHSADKLVVKRANNLINSGTIQATGSVEIGADRIVNIFNHGIIKSSQTFIAKAANKFKNLKHISAENIDIKAEEKFDNRSEILSVNNINISGPNAFINTGKVKADNDLSIEDVANLNNHGRLQAGEQLDLKVNIGNLYNAENAIIITPAYLAITANTVINEGSIASSTGDGHLTLTANGILNNQGNIISEGEAYIVSHGKLENAVSGIIDSGDRIIIEANDGMDNLGQLISVDKMHLQVKAKNFVNRGVVKSELAETNIVVSDGGVQNYSSIESPASLSITSKNDIQNLEDGIIRADGAVALVSVEGALVNKNQINSGAELKITAEKAIDNKGKIISESDLTLVASLINNKNIIKSEAEVTLEAKGDISNNENGLISGKAKVSIKSDNGSYIQESNTDKLGIISETNEIVINANKAIIANGGAIDGATGLTLLAEGVFENKGTNFTTKGVLKLDANEKVINAGQLSAGGNVVIGKTGLLNNSSLISSGAELDISKVEGNIENKGVLQGKDKVVINAGGKIENLNTIHSNHDVEITSQNDLINKASIFSGKNLTITSKAGKVSNNGSATALTGKTLITADKGYSQEDGYLWGGSAIEIIAHHGSFEAKGVRAKILTPRDLTITAEGAEFYKALIEAKSAEIKATGGGFINEAAKFTIDDQIKIDANSIDNNGIISAKNAVNFASSGATNLKEGSELITDGALTIASEGPVENKGYIKSNDATVVSETGQIINKGSLLALGGLKLQTTNGNAGSVENIGNINARSLNLDISGSLNNLSNINISDTINIQKAGKIVNNKNIKFGSLVSGSNYKLPSYEGKAGSVLEGQDLKLSIGVVDFPDGAIKVNNLLNSTFDYANLGKLDVSGTASNLNIMGALNNNKGLHFSGSNFTLSANSITNSGPGIIKGNNLTINSRSSLDNKGAIFGRTNLAINAPSWVSNSGGIFSAGTMSLSTAGTLTNDNLIISAGNAGISSGTINNRSNINSFSDLTLTGTVNNSGTLAGKRSVVIGGNLANTGRIISGQNGAAGTISITNNANFMNGGEILSYGNLNITTSSITNNGILEAYNHMQLRQTGAIINDSSIYAGTMDLSASSITNNARIITRDNMRLVASGGDIVNKNIIQLLNNGTISLAATNVINKISGVRINGIDSTQVNKILSPALLEEWKRTIVPHISYYNSGKFDAGGAGQTVQKINDWTWFSGANDGISPKPEQNGDKYEETIVSNLNYLSREPILVSRTGQKYTYEQTISVDNSAKQPLIASNGGVDIKAQNLIDNTGGKVQSRGSTNIEGQNLLNNDYANISFGVTTAIEQRRARFKEARTYFINTIYTAMPANFDTIRNDVAVASTIEAGGALTGNLSGAATIGSPSSGGGRGVTLTPDPYNPVGTNNQYNAINEPAVASVGPAPLQTIAAKTTSARNESAPGTPEFAEALDSSIILGPVELAKKYQTRSTRDLVTMEDNAIDNLANNIASQYASRIVQPEEPAIFKASDYDPQVSNKITWDDLELQALISASEWSAPSPPGQYYIKETSRVFTDFGTYFSTENFTDRIPGYNPRHEPQNNAVHLGDSMKQAEFVLRQHQELTGLSTIIDGLDYREQMKVIFERGATFSKAHNLTPQVKITPELAARIHDDIVLAEEVTIKGTKVIVPRLYLGAAKRGMHANGIIASQIDLKAGTLINDSNIIGSTVKLEIGDGGIANTNGGLIQADRQMDLRTSGDITNIGSKIKSGGTSYLEAQNIYNITEKETKSVGGSTWQQAREQAEISSVSDMFIKTRGDVRNVGARLLAHHLGLDIGGDMSGGSITLEGSTQSYNGNTTTRSQSVVYLPTTIEVAGNTQGFIAGDFTLLGSSLRSRGDNKLEIGGNTRLESQVAGNYSQSSSTTSKRDKLGNRQTKETSSQDTKETVFASSIEAGGANIISNHGDQEFIGATIKSGSGTHLKSRKSRLAALMSDDVSSFSSSYQDSVIQKNRASGYSRSHANTVQVEGGIEIDTKEGVEVDYGSGSGSKKGKFGSVMLDESRRLPEWMQNLENQAGVRLSAVEERSNSWNKKQTSLTPEAARIVSIAAGAATSWAGGFGGALTGSGLSAGSVGTVAMQAGATSMAGKASVSAINNGFDFSKVAKDVTSKESARDLATSMAIASINFGITEATGLGEVSARMNRLQRFQGIAEKGIIQAGVSSAVTGQNLGKSLEREAGSSMLAIGQSVVGDIGVARNLEDGGLAKTLMHAGVGAIYSGITTGNFASGAIGGAVSEIFTPSSKLEESSKALPVVSALASFLGGGSASDITTASNVASSAIENNRRLHAKELEILQEAQAGKSAEEQQRFKEAAMQLVRSDKGVSDRDDNYGQIQDERKRGKGHAKEKQELIALAEARGYHDLFQYGISDRVSDFFSRHNEETTRAAGAIKAGTGAAGVGSLAIGTFATNGIAGPLAAAGGTFSLLLAADGYNQAFGTYHHTEGAKVLGSFDVPTNSFAYDAHTNAGLFAAEIVGTTALVNGVVTPLGSVVFKAAKSSVNATASKAPEIINGSKVPPLSTTVTQQTEHIKLLQQAEKLLENAKANTASSKSVITSGKGNNGPPSVMEQTSLLLPNEGKAESYAYLRDEVSIIGDNLAIHHMPNKKYMEQFGVTKDEGISMLVYQPNQGTGGLHTAIHRELMVQNPNLHPRSALTESVLRTRKVHKEYGRYEPEIIQGLLDVINQNKTTFPELFVKTKK